MDVTSLPQRLNDRWISIGARVLMAGVLVAQPAAAQTGIEFLQEGFCGGLAAQLVGAVWAGAVLYYGVYKFLYRATQGLDKFQSTDPTEQNDGKELIKGSVWSLGAALLLASGERVLAFIGIPMLECVNLGFSI